LNLYANLNSFLTFSVSHRLSSLRILNTAFGGA